VPWLRSWFFVPLFRFRVWVVALCPSRLEKPYQFLWSDHSNNLPNRRTAYDWQQIVILKALNHYGQRVVRVYVWVLRDNEIPKRGSRIAKLQCLLDSLWRDKSREFSISTDKKAGPHVFINQK
jgi:hypothetical protein